MVPLFSLGTDRNSEEELARALANSPFGPLLGHPNLGEMWLNHHNHTHERSFNLPYLQSELSFSNTKNHQKRMVQVLDFESPTIDPFHTHM